jgi:hypothetical protein
LPLDHYLLSPETWASKQSGLDRQTGAGYLEDRRAQLEDRFRNVEELLREQRLPDVRLESGKLSISPLKANVPDEAELWADRIYDVLPRIHLTDLLMEVDSWTGFSKCFTHLYAQQPAADTSMNLSVYFSGFRLSWPEGD